VVGVPGPFGEKGGVAAYGAEGGLFFSHSREAVSVKKFGNSFRGRESEGRGPSARRKDECLTGGKGEL